MFPTGADIGIIVAYGALLDEAALNMLDKGWINLHYSLLPKWRGAAPVQRAIMAGDRETGVTTMRMDEGLDTGPMLLAERTPISAADSAEAVHDRLAELGARLMERARWLREFFTSSPSSAKVAAWPSGTNKGS